METTATVTALESYGQDKRVDAQIIRLKTAQPFSYEAGQYVMLAHDDFRLRANLKDLKWTAYSIASSPQDDELTFVYAVKRTGGFTQFLSEHLKKGSSMRLKGPYGAFTLDTEKKEKIFIATGAGIAPIRSMIRTLQTQSNTNFRLLYGFRSANDYHFRYELERLSRIKTIASQDSSWPRQGHVQDLLAKEKFSPQTQNVYICGNPDMVRDVTNLLVQKGFAKESIKSEQW